MTPVICLRCDATSNAADAHFCRVCGARLPRLSPSPPNNQPNDDQPDTNQPTLHSAPTLLHATPVTPANDALINDDDPLGLTANGDDELTRVQTPPPSHASRSSRRPIHVPIPPRAQPSPAEILASRRAMPTHPFLPPPPPPSKAKTYILYFVGIILAVSLGVWLALRVQEENFDDDATAMPAATDTFTPAAVNPNDVPAENLVTAQLEAAADSLARGDAPRAVELLRLVIASDPKNSQAYLQLGEALEITGNRPEAIVAYTAAVQNAPTLAPPLQRLAAANFAAAMFLEAAANYRALLALPAAKNTIDDNLLLRAAEAYRAAGQLEDARKLFTRLALSKTVTTRDLARRTLTELDNLALLTAPPPSSTSAPNPSPSATPNAGNAAPTSSPTPNASTASTASLPPAERFRRAIQLWTRDRTSALPELRAVAAEIPEANYYLGLSFAEGRDPKELARAELLAALRHFQLARNTQFSQQARRYEEQLTAEYDKRRSQ
ncbi:MAG: bacterial transcriptional activator domain-containing protein [Pyrinomonadaceae bacterium MAG19_C2-C3]|nr:bacterial transcriptional activator domain-containing protein [Pyrinomonadaceae bacterium MAG19_C2-C3]